MLSLTMKEYKENEESTAIMIITKLHPKVIETKVKINFWLIKGLTLFKL